MIEAREPVTELTLEAPAGLIRVRADVHDGKVTGVTFLNVPAFAVHLDREIDVPHLGRVIVDVAWGGMFYVIADADALGVTLDPANGRRIAQSIRDRLAFVMSFGGHGDLARAMHYLTSGQVLGDLETAKKSSAVLGADHVGVHPPHDYGLAVVLLNLAESVPKGLRPEFGRTVRQNGNGGTDHGHGNVMWLLGGRVAGGKIHGRWPGLDSPALYEGRDLAVTHGVNVIVSSHVLPDIEATCSSVIVDKSGS